MANAKKQVLISGAGVAGPAIAYLLAPLGNYEITILERAAELRNNGQQVDVSSYGMEVAERMGLLEEMRSRKVVDRGMRFVDMQDRIKAVFPVQTGATASSWVKEVEIMRGHIVDIFYERTKDHADVTYLFDESLTSLREDGAGVTVSYASGRPDARFDLVIGADGIRSKTRSLAFTDVAQPVHSLNQVVGHITIPWEKQDEDWSRWANYTEGRIVSVRPRKAEGLTGAFVGICTPDAITLARKSPEEQRAEVQERFGALGWEAPRVLAAIREGGPDNDFYMQEVAQVRMKSWTRGRVALLGDAGYCPSPLTGHGITLSLTGTYILAGCLAESPDDIPAALQRYDRDMQPYVKELQSLIPGVPQVACPQTRFGIFVLNQVLWFMSFASSLGIERLATLVSSKQKPLPVYPRLDKVWPLTKKVF